jgi:hypothetical protein
MGYYVGQKEALMVQGRGFAEGTRALMIPQYGTEKAEAISAGMVEHFERIIPELPYIGGDSNKNLTETLIQCSISMAFCLAVRDKGKSFDDAGRISYMVVSRFMEGNPPPEDKRTVQQKRDDQKHMAEYTQSHAQEFPEGWLAEYVERVPEPFTHGTDYTECGNLKLCEKLGIAEFAPYICMMDKITYSARGQGMTRTQALALGSDRCDFRFSEDGIVRLEEPFIVETFHTWGIDC